MTRVAIHGAAGRMGCRLIAVGHADPEIDLVGALESPDYDKHGLDAGTVAGVGEIGVPIGMELPAETQVVVDFATHEAFTSILERCLSAEIPLVIATTGLSAEQEELIRKASATIPIVWAPSMSMTVNLTMKLAEIAASALGQQDQQVDVEIIERHHRFKADAPSGTALRFGELIRTRLNLTDEVHGREGLTGQRTANEIGYHAVRVGDNPGEHTIVFGMLGETMELRVAASNRDCYASGAFAAAKFVAAKSSGLFNMYDVLGI